MELIDSLDDDDKLDSCWESGSSSSSGGSHFEFSCTQVSVLSKLFSFVAGKEVE
jgi:hypothetical protein